MFQLIYYMQHILNYVHLDVVFQLRNATQYQGYIAILMAAVNIILNLLFLHLEAFQNIYHTLILQILYLLSDNLKYDQQYQ